MKNTLINKLFKQGCEINLPNKTEHISDVSNFICDCLELDLNIEERTPFVLSITKEKFCIRLKKESEEFLFQLDTPEYSLYDNSKLIEYPRVIPCYSFFNSNELVEEIHNICDVLTECESLFIK